MTDPAGGPTTGRPPRTTPTRKKIMTIRTAIRRTLIPVVVGGSLVSGFALASFTMHSEPWANGHIGTVSSPRAEASVVGDLWPGVCNDITVTIANDNPRPIEFDDTNGRRRPVARGHRPVPDHQGRASATPSQASASPPASRPRSPSPPQCACRPTPTTSRRATRPGRPVHRFAHRARRRRLTHPPPWCCPTAPGSRSPTKASDASRSPSSATTRSCSSPLEARTPPAPATTTTVARSTP